MAEQVFDFRTNEAVPVNSKAVAGSPVPPENDGDAKIWVSIVSYRDGERCGETISSLFENAKDPERIIVSIVEQNDASDSFCLEVYCKKFGLDVVKRRQIREGMTKLIGEPEKREQCPHMDKVRYLAYHHINAKGPTFARSMARKNLGNEEFCMQIDAHTAFAKDWDEMVLEEWKNANNEFGVITSVPPPMADKEKFSVGGELEHQVPRQCMIKFRDNNFPNYESPADGYALNLQNPLLSHGWSAAFSFAKCHLEETTPYDPFLHYAMPIEQFSRYARMWTRGYDTYTPTRNVVFHDYGPQANGHGNNEWFRRQRNRFRQAAIERVKTALQISGGIPEEKAQANLGIYGVGKRRSLEQLQEFTNMNFGILGSIIGQSQSCSGSIYVPYDAEVSPADNLFENPDNLDPQPEFPLRTELKYYEQVQVSTEDLLDLPDVPLVTPAKPKQHQPKTTAAFAESAKASNLPPTSLLFVMWAFGLIMWCTMFAGPPPKPGKRPRRPRAPTPEASKEV